jgi:hypothetical protein
MTDNHGDEAVPETAVTAAPIAPATTATPTAPGERDAPDWSVSTVVAPSPDYSEAGVPSLDFVRDKIEGRYAHSLGSTELAQETPAARSLAEQAAKREEAARDKLAAIRSSLRGNSPS